MIIGFVVCSNVNAFQITTTRQTTTPTKNVVSKKSIHHSSSHTLDSQKSKSVRDKFNGPRRAMPEKKKRKQNREQKISFGRFSAYSRKVVNRNVCASDAVCMCVMKRLLSDIEYVGAPCDLLHLAVQVLWGNIA